MDFDVCEPGAKTWIEFDAPRRKGLKCVDVQLGTCRVEIWLPAELASAVEAAGMRDEFGIAVYYPRE